LWRFLLIVASGTQELQQCFVAHCLESGTATVTLPILYLNGTTLQTCEQSCDGQQQSQVAVMITVIRAILSPLMMKTHMYSYTHIFTQVWIKAFQQEVVGGERPAQRHPRGLPWLPYLVSPDHTTTCCSFRSSMRITVTVTVMNLFCTKKGKCKPKPVWWHGDLLVVVNIGDTPGQGSSAFCALYSGTRHSF